MSGNQTKNRINESEEETKKKPGLLRGFFSLFSSKEKKKNKSVNSDTSSVQSKEEEDLFEFDSGIEQIKGSFAQNTKNSSSKRQEPENAMSIPWGGTGFENIREMLGAGQSGNLQRLSDIFLKEERILNLTDSESKDPYNANRYLN